jgi:ketosteroid isomerase-like protein
MSSQPDRGGSLRRLDDASVELLERHWTDGWNRRDVDTIMAPFAADVVFSSPGIALMTGDPSRTTIEGSDALRAYIEEALRRSPPIRYALRSTYVGVDGIVIVYSCELPNGTDKPGADSMRVGRDGKVVEWRCHY